MARQSRVITKDKKVSAIKQVQDLAKAVVEESNLNKSQKIQSKRIAADKEKSKVQKKILRNSREKDSAEIKKTKKISSKLNELKINKFLQKSLVYVTASGIMLLSINIIIRAIFYPSLLEIVANVLAIFGLAMINERIK